VKPPGWAVPEDLLRCSAKYFSSWRSKPKALSAARALRWANIMTIATGSRPNNCSRPERKNGTLRAYQSSCQFGRSEKSGEQDLQLTSIFLPNAEKAGLTTELLPPIAFSRRNISRIPETGGLKEYESKLTRNPNPRQSRAPGPFSRVLCRSVVRMIRTGQSLKTTAAKAATQKNVAAFPFEF